MLHRHLSRFAAVLALAALAAPAHAQLARSFSAATYTGVGVSQLDTDFKNLKKGYDLDAVGGYNVTPEQAWGRIAAELNLGVTVSPGKNTGASQSTTTPGSGGGVLGGGTPGTTTTQSGRFTQSSSDLQALIFTLQAVYRSPGRFYGIGALGYSLTNTSIQEIEDKGRSGITFGGGAGFKFGANTAAVELLYTKVSSDLQTIGVRFVY